jgi:hypothetical protein
MIVSLSALAILAAGVAFGWPYLRWPQVRASGRMTAASRANWVNRLFALAVASDAAGDSEVAASARALIAALVGRSAPTGKAK